MMKATSNGMFNEESLHEGIPVDSPLMMGSLDDVVFS